jgi:hypothetical protein
MPRSGTLNIPNNDPNNEQYPQQITASTLPNDDINDIKKGAHLKNPKFLPSGKKKNKKVNKIFLRKSLNFFL